VRVLFVAGEFFLGMSVSEVPLAEGVGVFRHERKRSAYCRGPVVFYLFLPDSVM